jgi:Ran GTPase-activating protein (RanGAP) involved in mRNA processing and transport
LTDFAAFAATGALAEGPDGTEGLQRLIVRRRVWDRDVGATALAAALQHLPGLQELDASESMISDAGAALLAAGLPRCEALTTLKLRDNQIGTAGVAALAAVLPRLPNLTTLDLALNAHMGDAGAAVIAAVLPRLPTLTRLDLSNNELTAAGLRPLLQALPATFQTLRLDRNPLGPEGARYIAALVPRLPALQALNVQGCHIRNEGIQVLVEALRGHTELTELDLGESRATKDAVRAVVDLLTTLPNITRVGFLFGGRTDDFYTAVRETFPGKTVYVPPDSRGRLLLRPRRRERKHRDSRRRSTRRSTRRRSTPRRLTRRNDQRNDRRNDSNPQG